MKHSPSSIFQIKPLAVAIMLATLSLELGTWNCQAQSANKEQAVPYTLEDRDRAVRMEVKMNERFESMQKEMNIRFEAMNTRFESIDTRFEAMNDKLDKLYTLIYFVLGGVFGLFGFIMWDRRSYIKPVKENIAGLQSALKEYAKEQPKLADILRSHGLL